MRKREKLKEAKLEGSSSEEDTGKRKYEAASDDDAEANEDLSYKIVQKSIQRAAKRNPRDDGATEIVTNLKDDIRKKEKKKRSKIKVAEETIEMDPGFKDFCSDLILADNDQEIEKPVNDNAVEIAIKGAQDVGTEVTNEVETNAASLSDNAVLRKLLRGPRYFDPPENNSWGACYNCGEEGHTTANCTSARRKKPCFVCGSFEHNAKQCSKGRDCFICKQQGHRAKDCPEKNNISKLCLKCGDLGHDFFSCRNDYCPDDLKEVQCYICGVYGHLCCKDYTDPGPREVSCYRCGQSGHTGLACSGSRWNSNDVASPGSCYKCGAVGHFARECNSSLKACKRNREPSTPKHKSAKMKWDHLETRSAPHDIGKMRKKNKPKSIEYSSPGKAKKHRVGWTTDHPEDHYGSRSKDNHWRSPATPKDRKSKIYFSNGDYATSSHSSRKTGTNDHHDTPSRHHQRPYSASRFGNNSNGGMGRNNGRWYRGRE